MTMVNVLANGIIEAADAYAEHEKAQLSCEGTTSDRISGIDTISVLEIFTQTDTLGHTPRQIVEALPSAQPATNCSEIPNGSDDTISRQAAIDLFPNDALEWDTKGGYIAPHLARRMIEELPSVQSDHNADISKKVEQTGETAQNVQNEDLISRKWLMECIEEGWVKFDTAKDCNRMMHLVRDIAPSVQPEQNAQDEDLISRKAAIEALARMMPRSYTPDGSHPADEEIFRAQEVFADCIEALEILPSAQPEQRWIPVTERLPERADNVIICYKAGDYTLVSTGRYLYKFKMWYVDVVGDLRDGVTAWMPLPEPYRGGEK